MVSRSVRAERSLIHRSHDDSTKSRTGRWTQGPFNNPRKHRVRAKASTTYSLLVEGSIKEQELVDEQKKGQVEDAPR